MGGAARGLCVEGVEDMLFTKLGGIRGLDSSELGTTMSYLVETPTTGGSDEISVVECLFVKHNSEGKTATTSGA